MNSPINSMSKEQSKCKQTNTRPISSYDNLDSSAFVTATTTQVAPATFANNNYTNSTLHYPIATTHNNQHQLTQMNGSNLILSRIQNPSSSSAISNTNYHKKNPNIDNQSSNLHRNISSVNSFVTARAQQPSSLSAATTSTPQTLESSTTTKLLPDDALNINHNNNDFNSKKNIVVVSHIISKPVISDAKSKFFGINNNNNILNSSIVEDNQKSNKYEGIKLTTELLIASPQLAASTTNVETTKSNSTTTVTVPSSIAPITELASHITLELNGNTKKNITGNTEQLKASDCNSENYSKIFDPREYNQNIHQQQQQNFSTGDKTYNNYRSDLHEMDVNQPSQAVYMSTTVPQNIKGSDIAGRHTPTRNSLRHSRMLVINKNFQEPKIQNPLGLKYPHLTRILLIHHIVFGILLTCVGFWILLWAPNTRLQDNPYWSGITLSLAGILGLIVIKFKRTRRNKIRENCFIFLKYDSYLLTFVATVLCLIAFICASIHLLSLSSTTTKCASANILIANSACTCIYDIIESTTDDTSSSIQNATQSAIVNGRNVKEFHYRDLSCGEVFGAWKFLLTVSVLLNALGFCVTILYTISIFWRRNKKNMYTSVKTNPF